MSALFDDHCSIMRRLFLTQLKTGVRYPFYITKLTDGVEPPATDTRDEYINNFTSLETAVEQFDDSPRIWFRKDV